MVMMLPAENTSLLFWAARRPSWQTRPTCSGDFVTLDIGVKIGGYCSDMTRTFALGRATHEMRQVYDLVLQAQLAGHKTISSLGNSVRLTVPSGDSQTISSIRTPNCPGR